MPYANHRCDEYLQRDSVRRKTVKGEAPERWGTMMPPNQKISQLQILLEFTCGVKLCIFRKYDIYEHIPSSTQGGRNYHVQRPLNIEAFFLEKRCRTFFQAKFNQRQRSALLKEVCLHLFFPMVFSRQKPKWVRKMMIAIFTYIYIYMCQ